MSDIVDLDSLMDILSCLVGVMLFIVIYTVLQLGSTSFNMVMPIVRDPPDGSQRVLVVANRGTVRLMDTNGPIDRLLEGVERVLVTEVPRFVRDANREAPIDDNFLYALGYEDRGSVFTGVTRSLVLEVSEVPGAVGDSLHQLGDTSTFARHLAQYDPATTWLAFAVDSVSLDLFRRARDFASERGFATGWDPLDLDFPAQLSLTEGPGGPSPSTSLSKPQR